MNSFFESYIKHFVLVFFGDILVYSSNLTSHLSYLQIVLETLRSYSLFAKFSKCSFPQNQIEYLGHIVTRDGIITDLTKIENMISWPTPKNIKALRGFLGLIGYYRRFAKKYGFIAKHLTELLKKDKFEWFEEAEKSFQQLKLATSSTLC